MLFLMRNLMWGLIVFQSFAALGRLIARLVKSDRKREVAVPAACGLAGMTVVILMVQVPFANTTSYLGSTVLFLTLVRLAYTDWQPGGERRNGALFLLTLVTAALCALKTSYVCFVGLFLVIWSGLRLLQPGHLRALKEIAFIAVVIPVLLSPWMLQQYRSALTPLYPVLGKGVQPTGPGMEPFSDSLTDKVKATAYFFSHGENIAPVLALVFLACNPFRDDRSRWRVLLAAMLAALGGSLFLCLHTASNALGRYTQSMLFAALIPIGLAGFFSPRPSRPNLALALCLALFVGNRWDNLYSGLSHFIGFARAGQPGLLYTQTSAAGLQKAQAAIPPGKTTIVWLQDAFLLDSVRNPILNLDEIGLASPPPGMPLTSDPDGLADYLAGRTPRFPSPAAPGEILQYLRNHGVDFLMFQRGDSAWYRINESRLRPKPYWNRLIGTFCILGYKDLLALVEHTRTVYDDGDIIVLDLTSPRAGSGDPPRA